MWQRCDCFGTHHEEDPGRNQHSHSCGTRVELQLRSPARTEMLDFPHAWGPAGTEDSPRMTRTSMVAQK
jgi:hypothetical protein